MHTLILCCAGESLRFPGYRPKWSLTHPSGNIMAVESIRGLLRRGLDLRIIVAVRASHNIKSVEIHSEFFEGLGLDVEVMALPDTANQVDTVACVLRQARVVDTFTVKDCDNAFDCDLDERNSVAVYPLASMSRVGSPGGKSYVEIDTLGRIASIEEKRVLDGGMFCCGAYTFADPRQFLLSIDERTTFVSHVIDRLLVTGESFIAMHARNYEDWGTAAEWRTFCRQWKTLFCDIDGLLFKSGHRSFHPTWSDTEAIESNVAHLRKLHATGRVHIVLTTSRPESWRNTTIYALKRADVPYHQLVMGLPACSRIIANDHDPARGQHTCFSVNIERNAGSLEHALRAAMFEDE